MTNNYFRWFVLLAVGLAAGVTGVNTLHFTPVLGDVAADLGVSLPAAQSSILGIFVFFVALSTIISGAVADRFGVVPVLLAGNLAGVLPNLLFPFIGHIFGAVIVLRIFQGFGAGAVFSLIPLVAAQWFAENERGRVVGSGMTMLNAGMMIGVLASPLLFHAVGNWRSSMGWIGIVEGVLFLFTLYVVYNYEENKQARVRANEQIQCFPYEPELKESMIQPAIIAEESGLGQLKVALSNSTTYIGIIVCICISWLLNALNDLTPQYFALNVPIGVGFGRIMAGQLMVLVQLGTVFGGVIGGFVMDKVFRGNPKPVLYAGFIIAMVTVYAIILPGVYNNTVILMIDLFLAGLAVAFLNPAVAVFIAKVYPGKIVGRIVGMWLGIGAFGGSLGIFVSALALHATGTYHLIVELFAVVGIIGIILVQIMKKNIFTI
ncbi:MAG: rane protein, major facilitator superfamily [Firmicutes bacterium]|nr:rane protein, major facilitator superfamily [Bacillota bacterium]